MSTSPLTLAEALAEAAHQINIRRPLPELLQDLVDMASRSLPGVDHVGISVTHADGRVETIAATDDLVLKLDQLQYDLDEGPCLTAIREEGMVLVNHADREQRWPRFMEHAAALGLRSQMGLRLYANNETVGGLNLYATKAAEIDPDIVRIANLFAEHAALALGKSRREENLIHGMMTRQRIGVAVGLLMRQYGLDEDRAFQYLARVSQNSNTKLRDIADEIVDSANKGNGLSLTPTIESSKLRRAQPSEVPGKQGCRPMGEPEGRPESISSPT
ncbi:MAG TPA: GAF and ANTAR domain-containing protein [Nonomuraea sp.]|nr:GAF and ANTAR domain-containing protein [Nonomuraea sp.]